MDKCIQQIVKVFYFVMAFAVCLSIGWGVGDLIKLAIGF